MINEKTNIKTAKLPQRCDINGLDQRQIVGKVFREAFPYTKPKRRTKLQQGADLSGEECSTQSSLVDL